MASRKDAESVILTSESCLHPPVSYVVSCDFAGR